MLSYWEHQFYYDYLLRAKMLSVRLFLFFRDAFVIHVEDIWGMKKSITIIRCIVLLLYLGLMYIAFEMQDTSGNVQYEVEKTITEYKEQ